MKQKSSLFVPCFAAIMLIFSLFLAWYIPSEANLRFRIGDLETSLDTSRGRERKQQAEYDQVVTDIPATQARLEETRPLAEAAEAELSALKAEKKKLKEEKKALQAAQAESSGEGSGNE